MRNIRKKGRRYFEGWYFKQQSDRESVALIPAFHTDGTGETTASLQVITDSQVCHIDFRPGSFDARQKRLPVRLGKCVFSPSGCELDAESEGCSLSGSLRFGTLKPPAYDIMGPFCAVPFMECRHSVLSLYHRVDGRLTLNGRQFLFDGGSGYIEGDRGVSFPERYVWTHCAFQGNSVMLSAAQIPFGWSGFVGCTGFIYWNGKERRIATYCGANLLHVGNDAVLLRQGKLMLKIRLLRENSRILRAPLGGGMTRGIHESVSCRVQYTCAIDGKLLFDFVSDQASFENNWRNDDDPVK